jgi:hypothetical protein
MSAKYEMILKEEILFAKNVALQIRALKPQPLWHLLIPFKFLLEFFAAKQEVDRFADSFLMPRKLALDAAHQFVMGEDRDRVLASVGNHLRNWLSEQKLFSRPVYQKLMAEVDVLIDHYVKLLQAEGNSYEVLVRNAYQTREPYAALLQELSTLEKAIDEAVVQMAGGDEIMRKHLTAKQEILAESRARKLRSIFK